MSPKLIFHIGSLKTGTTAIQAALHNDRARLMTHGIHYPKTAPEFPPTRPAHHRIAHAVANLGLRNRVGLALFFPRILRQAKRFDVTLLSAEPVYRHVAISPTPIDEDAWFAAHEVYLRRFAAYLQGFDVKILLYLRHPQDYAVSLYKEAIAKPQSAGMPDFEDMLLRLAPQFNYPRHIALLSDIFHGVEVRSYEAEAEKGLVPSFYSQLGLAPPEVKDKRVRTSVSNRAVAWLRMHIGQGSEREQGRRILYAVWDPDKLFQEKAPSTLWPSREVLDRFTKRHAAACGMDLISDAPRPTAPPCIWTAEMHGYADESYTAWCKANLEMLKAREAKGLRHYQT